MLLHFYLKKDRQFLDVKKILFQRNDQVFWSKHEVICDRFSDWIPYQHRVKANVTDVDGDFKIVPVPPNQVCFSVTSLVFEHLKNMTFIVNTQKTQGTILHNS